MTKKPNLDLDAILDKYDSHKDKRNPNILTPEEEAALPPIKEKMEKPKEEPRNFSVLMRGTKNDVRVIRKSEYDSLIHICL